MTGLPLRRAAWLAGWVAGPVLLARPGALGPAEPSPVRVSVLVPARNEESSLPALLSSLAAQQRPPDEVIVVDDASSDRTAEVAAAAGAVVLTSSGPPAGWSGKCWALHQAQAVATGELLVFVDADVTVAPDGLARLVAEHARLGGRGIVSAEPWHRTGVAVERVSAVANVAALMGTGAFGPWRREGGAPRPLAFGPCLAVDRLTYDAAGGHAAPDVRSRICEDLHLARAVSGVGAPVAVFAGGDAVAMRMYPEGLRQAFDGWTKVLATGAGASPPAAALATAAWVATGVVAAVGGGRAALRLLRGGRPRGGDVAAYATWAAQLGWLQRRAGDFGPTTAAAFPVPLAFFVAASARSAWSIGLGRPLAWRGRSLTGRRGPRRAAPVPPVERR